MQYEHGEHRNAAILGVSIVCVELFVGKILAMLAILGRGHTVALFESAGEIELVAEAKPYADIVDGHGH